MKFRVIDKKTGKEADTWNIALHEEWAQGLVYCDMEGFAITEDGYLVLMDECGNVVYCDPERFKVVFEDERPHGEWIFSGVEHYADNPIDSDSYYCSICKRSISTTLTRPEDLYPFCHCGADMRKRGDKK